MIRIRITSITTDKNKKKTEKNVTDNIINYPDEKRTN